VRDAAILVVMLGAFIFFMSFCFCSACDVSLENCCGEFAFRDRISHCILSCM